MIRTKVTGPDIAALASGLESEVAGFVTAAMRDTTVEVKDAFRAQVRAANLGDRLANAVRGVAYPRSRNSLNPAGWIYAQPSKDGRGAAAIIDSYASGANIVPRAGKRWLAVPSDDCPRHRSGDAFTPTEVEDKFGRMLTFISPSDKGFRTPSMRHRGVAYLVLKNLVVSKATGRYKRASATQIAGTARNPRQLQAVIMFTLVPGVKKPKSVDLSAPAALAEQRFDANLTARWR